MTSTKLPKQGRSIHLRWQVLTWLTACAFVALSAMALQGYHCARQAIVELETMHLRSVLEARKARILDWFKERKRDLVEIASYPCTWQGCAGGPMGVSSAGNMACCRMLDQVRASCPSFDCIAAYNTSWHRVAGASQNAYSDQELVPKAFRARLEQTRGVVVDPPRLYGAAGMGIHLGVPVLGNDGKRIGYVAAVALLSRTLYPILEDTSGLRPSTKTYIVSTTGRFLSGPRARVKVLSRGTNFPPGFLQGYHERAATYRDSAGVPVLAMASPMPQLGWVLVAETNKASAFAWLGTLRLRAALTSLVVFGLVALLGAAGARRVARPFHELRDVASRVAAGNYGERVSMLESAEAQEVGQAFNAMLDELSSYSQKLANAGALAAVGQLSSSIVHEMRNPLSSIKLNIAAIGASFAPGSDDRELADIALREATRVEGMLNDLLAYGKPLALSLQPVPLRRLLECAAEHAEGACRSRHIENRIAWNGHEETTLVLDEEQMLRALCNLVDNAVAFSPDHSIVEISVNTPGDAPETVEISIRDHGQGIPTERLPRVFEPFFTTRERGTGLGLANVKKIVECHEGTVRATNHPDGGALLLVRLSAGKRNHE